MFLNIRNDCFTGIALKRSTFSTSMEFLEAILFTDHYHPFIFIDYEGKEYLPTPDELNSILEQIKNFLILTVSIRSFEFHRSRTYLLENYLRLIRSHSNIGFCIVAGHPSYSSVDTRIPTNKAFNYTLSRIRKKTNLPVFLGIENVPSSFVRQLIVQYGNVIPFVLHGDSRAIKSNNLPVPFAVYSPLTYKILDDKAITFLSSYIVRRKYTKRKLIENGFFPIIQPTNLEELPLRAKEIVNECFQEFVLSSSNFETKISHFIKNGARLIVGNPAVPSQTYNLIKNFRIITDKYFVYPEF